MTGQFRGEKPDYFLGVQAFDGDEFVLACFTFYDGDRGLLDMQ